jgi:uncharacterized membrane protein YcjF (UPF0283 family)
MTASRENMAFVEQFRYIIASSQLLSLDINHSRLDRQSYSRSSDKESDASATVEKSSVTGVLAISAVAFCFAWLLHWTRGSHQETTNWKRVLFTSAVCVITIAFVLKYVCRQWLKMLRHEVIASSTVFVENSEGFDVAASAAITFIQEVELVSRGYRM